jgi:hypothetical protein
VSKEVSNYVSDIDQVKRVSGKVKRDMREKLS